MSGGDRSETDASDDMDRGGVAEDAGPSRRSVALGAGVVAALALGSKAIAGLDVMESDVDVSTPDGIADAAFFHPSGSGQWPAVLIWTDILGLRPVFRQMGRRLAGQGYVVLVPNPYYRMKHAPVIEGSLDLRKPEERARIMPFAQALTPEGTARDAKAFVAFLDGKAQTDKGRKAGVQGYCMGGPLAFRTAAACSDRVAAAASFHGGNLVTDKPSSPHLSIPQAKANFYCGVADNDDKKEPATKTVLRDAFAAAGRPAEVVVYAGANHGWCVAGSPAYDEASAERAWTALSELYRKVLA